MADRSCNLECVKHDKGGDNAIEFVGPVKIILVDQPRSAYICKTCYAAAILLAQMMMALTTMTVMFFSLSYKRSDFFKALHVFLCTVGLQVILPSGVLSLNNLNGSAAPMKPSDRKSEHIFLECFGLACTIAGSVVSLFSGSSNLFTLHACLGIAASILAILCAVTGLFIYNITSQTTSTADIGVFRRFIYYLHQLFGTFAISSSSICFICGIIKTPFIKWLPLNDIFYYIIIFCVFYTFVILYKPLKQIF